MNLNGVRMYVSATAARGVVGSETRLHFVQKGSRVFGKYAGGAIERAVSYAAQGRLRIVEHFEWSTREGAGTNVFDQLE